MILTTTGMEITKLRKRPMTWILMVLMGVTVVGLYAALFAVLQAAQSAADTPQAEIQALQGMLLWPAAFPSLLGLSAGNAFGGIMLVVLVGTVVAQEYTWRTAHLWLGQGAPRAVFLLGKFAALVITALILTAIPVLAGGLLTGCFTYHITGSLDPAAVNWGQVFLGLLRTTYALLPYLALTFLIAILSRSVAASVGIGLAYTLLVESILIQLLALAGGWLASLIQYTPGGLAATLMALNQSTMEMGVTVDIGGGMQMPEPWVAVLGIALYTAAFLGLALWAFRRQDLTG